MTNPQVLVIVLNWNGWKDTIECLETVLRSRYHDYQVVVVDNGSTDGSLEILSQWAKGQQAAVTPPPTNRLYSLSHPALQKPIAFLEYTSEEASRGGSEELEIKATETWRQRANSQKNDAFVQPTSLFPVILIGSPKNVGFAAGCNIGIRYALTKTDCRYVLLLNNDTVVHQDLLRNLVGFMTRFPNAAAATCKIFYYNAPNLLWYAGGRMSWIKGSHVHFGAGKRDSGQYDVPRNITFVTGCCMMMRVKELGEACLLSEAFFMGGEDHHLSWSLRRTGRELVYTPDARLWHKVRRSRPKWGVGDVYYGIASKALFMRSVLPRPIWFLWLLAIGTYAFTVYAVQCRRGSDIGLGDIWRATMRGLLDGLSKEAITSDDVHAIREVTAR